MNQKSEVTLIFDIGTEGKKYLLLDTNMDIIYEEKVEIKRVFDEDGYWSDDFDHIEKWLLETVDKLSKSNEYELKYINFATIGAALVYLDENGKRFTPVYNNQKPLDSKVDEQLYSKWGGTGEFIRKTASPILQMTNAGIQILELKQSNPSIYKKIKHILHLPQYLSYLITHKITSEATSVGCHTAMWDFDEMRYHDWVKDEDLNLPALSDLSIPIPTIINNKQVMVGIGIHDSSATLVPHLKGSKEKFILVTTGSWVVAMNPFSTEPLTEREVFGGCLSYLDYKQDPVKSARLFLGYIHKTNTRNIATHFKVDANIYKSLNFNKELLKSLFVNNKGRRVFFKYGVPASYIDNLVKLDSFENFEHCYYQLIIDLAYLVHFTTKLVVDKSSDIRNIYITGGFSHNKLFTHALATICEESYVYTSQIDNSKALGATLVINNKDFSLDLNLVKSVLS